MAGEGHAVPVVEAGGGHGHGHLHHPNKVRELSMSNLVTDPTLLKSVVSETHQVCGI